MFKVNEEAWRVMYATASEKEQFLFNRCFNFVNINREDERVRREDAVRARTNYVKQSDKIMHMKECDVRNEITRTVRNKKGDEVLQGNLFKFMND